MGIYVGLSLAGRGDGIRTEKLRHSEVRCGYGNAEILIYSGCSPPHDYMVALESKIFRWKQSNRFVEANGIV